MNKKLLTIFISINIISCSTKYYYNDYNSIHTYQLNGNCIIAGKILCSSTNQPVGYVHVFLKGSSIISQSDKDGNYILSDVEPGNYILTAKLMGFKSYKKELNCNSNKVYIQNILLENEILKGVI